MVSRNYSMEDLRKEAVSNEKNPLKKFYLLLTTGIYKDSTSLGTAATQRNANGGARLSITAR